MPSLLERVRAIAFDLDGTLIDTAPDLALAANTMLESLGYPPLAKRQIEALIGDGIDKLVEGVLMALPGQRDELLVVLEPEERRAPGKEPASLCVCESGGFQDEVGDCEAALLPNGTR